MKPYTWLLFDADGTLFDYDLAEAKSLEASFREQNLHFDSKCADLYQKINKQIWLDFEHGLISAAALRLRRFELLFKAVEIQSDVEIFSACYLKNLGQAADLIEGAEETLRRLRKNHQMAIITNGLKDVQRSRLALSTIGDLFDAVIISEEVCAVKPDARFFQAAFEQIGQPQKDQVLVIGDSLSSDIAGGINFGLDTCWFNPQVKPGKADLKPTFEIHELKALIDLVEKREQL